VASNKKIAQSKKQIKTAKAGSAKIGQSAPRRLKSPQYHSFRRSKRIRHDGAKLPSAFVLLARSIGLLRRHWRLLGGIVLIYGLLQLVLVRGLGSGLNLSEIKNSIQDNLGVGQGRLLTGVALFGLLIGSAGSANDAGQGVYGFLLVLLVTLAIIWALRQTLAGHKPRVRDAYYNGMYPLVQFILVLLVIAAQLVPAALGSFVFLTVTSSGIAVTGLEQVLWALFFGLLLLMSLYMLCSSLFAPYIVTLPDMTPMKALRSARQLVAHRRWTVMRKLLFLALALFLAAVLLIIPLIIFATPLAEPLYYIFSIIVPLLVHTYMYTLYRELLE
jgi:hypothetical protein